MADKLTAPVRSALMGRVRNKNTAPETAVRRILHAMGYRFRLHGKALPGTPDIVLARHRTAVMVRGCFWHGHEGCRRAKLPETRREFWESKIGRNIARDAAAVAELETQGWRPLVIWECELKDTETLRARLSRHFEGTTD